MSEPAINLSFDQLSINPAIVNAVKMKGYSIPTPIQAKSIPILMSGQDLLGQAQTGTGKTAAFALPLLSKIDPSDMSTQVLVLTPTRELAIQVSQAFCNYGSQLTKINCTAVYGGASMVSQLKALKKGSHIVVGTPGRIRDHLRRRSLSLSNLKTIVLDEADEMLKMGFSDDIEDIMGKTPENKQVALFSATMPKAIRNIAAKHLKNEEQITIASKTKTVEAVNQYYCPIKNSLKAEALSHIIEASDTEAVLVFVRTRASAVQVSDALTARGHKSTALNGDLSQNLREQIIEKLKAGKINIVVATDVAARGLDIDRISHVVNYDIPFDAESYVHRIGRTGRAGRGGTAITFISNHERYRLASIERSTRQSIEKLTLPTAEEVSKIRIEALKKRIVKLIDRPKSQHFVEIIEELSEETQKTPIEIASALCRFVQKERPLFPPQSQFELEEEDKPMRPHRPRNRRRRGDERRSKPQERQRGKRYRHRSR